MMPREDTNKLQQGNWNSQECAQDQVNNRPYEIISSILAKGTRMQIPGSDNKISKANCLTMLEIRRDLRKYNSEAKIDSFYLMWRASVSPR